ncbi:Tm-1-like ATP-binding domain-containing protein, partial [Microbispora sp. NPDC049633]|uniref:Tm-1-like ATP-binding domain-containing protein n=1 Tax=Microbispora sp. NPDC049633 TaxID=3154355 RepID=UPI003430DD55
MLLGTLDTKAEEYRWVRDELREAGCDVLLVDVGTFAHGADLAGVGADEVARAAG